MYLNSKGGLVLELEFSGIKSKLHNVLSYNIFKALGLGNNTVIMWLIIQSSLLTKVVQSFCQMLNVVPVTRL